MTISKPPDAFISIDGSSQNDDLQFTSHSPVHDYLDLSLPFADSSSIPLNFLTRSSFKEIRTEASRVYIFKRDKPETITPVNFGRHYIRGGRDIIVAECDDRHFLEPGDDCILEVRSPAVCIWPANNTRAGLTWGITSKVSTSVPCSPSTDDLFKSISALCQVPGEESVMRSHPFFRRPLRAYPAAGGVPAEVQKPCPPAITFYLPPDLRYLYAAAPLACYAGASIEAGKSPAISVSGELLPLPGEAREFSRWSCNSLRYIFHVDCALRYETTTGRRLAGIDIPADTGTSSEKLLSMGIADRLFSYLGASRRSGNRQVPWHTASYVDPVPSSIMLIPSLLQSLSAIFYPAGRKVTEREVVQMEVRKFLGRTYRSGGITADGTGHVIMPVLEDAFVHQWLSDGYPIDAVKQLRTPVSNRKANHLNGQIPRIAIICNEDAMFGETIVLRDTLKSIASITMLRNVTRDNLLRTFAEGYDIVQFIGHCDNRGFKCPDGYADLSMVRNNTTSMFFFNSCSSYLQGIKLLEKGSTCGISTLYNVIDEAAKDVSVNFYRLLARGYPVLIAYLGARECSVLGKEYLLSGNGQISLFDKGASMPLYHLAKAGSGFTLSCILASPEKGLVYSAGEGDVPGLPDTGMVLRHVSLSALIEGLSLPDGSCVYDGRIFNSIGEAALDNLEQQPIPSVRSYSYTS
ncbi:hypothetical protein [Methanocella sp. MCL-LM]|uniref:hypothetical protein n=1 Tax=Methanocella sp. MCL-LM TaxID=3412035 RepID=UPI003C74CDAF